MGGVGSRNKLRAQQAHHYLGDSPLDVLGRALCAVGCLPRKESLHEAWEMTAAVRRSFRGGRVVDLCAGFGLVAQFMLLVDDTSASAVALDRKLPLNHQRVHEAIVDAFATLNGRVEFVQRPLREITLCADDVVVSSHACGSLTDDVIAHAVEARARVAVLPCCHGTRFRADLVGHADPAGALDDERVERLRRLGYRVWRDSIPSEVSPKNRLILGAPHDPAVAT